LTASVRSASSDTGEYRIIWQDGTAQWVGFRARIVSDRFGRNATFGREHRYRVMQKRRTILKHPNETLEPRVAKRTAELEPAHAKALAEIGRREHAKYLLIKRRRSK
jgi:hypothetical protein